MILTYVLTNFFLTITYLSFLITKPSKHLYSILINTITTKKLLALHSLLIQFIVKLIYTSLMTYSFLIILLFPHIFFLNSTIFLLNHILSTLLQTYQTYFLTILHLYTH